MAAGLDTPEQIQSSLPDARMTWTQRYLSLRYRDDEANPFRCWELYWLYVKQECGVTLPPFNEVRASVSVMKTLAREKQSDRWIEVAVMQGGVLVYQGLGEEKKGDLVLMHGIVGRRRFARAVPLHCGAVVRPGILIELENVNGVMIRPFRDTLTRRASPTARTRVIGIYRPSALI
jgi:hypothetical protein